MKRSIALLAATALVLAACGDGHAKPVEADDIGNAPTTQAPDTGGETPLANDAGVGPGIRVTELLAATSDGPFLVNGYVFVGPDGEVVISDGMAESFPPQPAGAQVSVAGIDVMQLPIVESPVDGDVPTAAWTEQPVQLLGDLVDGVFVGNPLAPA